MIVVVEGPRCAGKSMFAKALWDELKDRGISANVWKSKRGEDPVSDMLSSLADFTEDRVWILDRFHLTEWTNSFILQRGWFERSVWAEIVKGLMGIDNKLRDRKAIIILLTAQAHVLKRRLRITGREDVNNDPEHILKTWEGIFGLTRCDAIHLHNDTSQMLARNVDIAADLIKGRIR